MTYRTCKLSCGLALLLIPLSVIAIIGFSKEKSITQRSISNLISIKGVLFSGIVDDAFKQLIPLSVKSGNHEVQIVDFVYVTEGERPSLLAIVVPKMPTDYNFRPKNIIRVGQQLTSIANDASLAFKDFAWVAAVKIDIHWIPWEMQLVIAELSVTENLPATSTSSSSYLVELQKNGTPIYSLKTDELKIEISKDQFVTYKIALSFVKDRINAFGFTGDSNPDLVLDTVDAALNFDRLPTFTNLIVSMSDDHINQLAAQHFNRTKLIIKPNNVQEESYAIKSFRLKCDDSRIKSDVILQKEGVNQDFVGSTVWQGDDLMLRSVSISPIVDDCGTKPSISKLSEMARWTECKVKNAALRALSSTISSTLSSKFNGQPLRPVSLKSPIPLKIDEKTKNCNFITLKSQSEDGRLVVYLNTTLN